MLVVSASFARRKGEGGLESLRNQGVGFGGSTWRQGVV